MHRLKCFNVTLFVLQHFLKTFFSNLFMSSSTLSKYMMDKIIFFISLFLKILYKNHTINALYKKNYFSDINYLAQKKKQS